MSIKNYAKRRYFTISIGIIYYIYFPNLSFLNDNININPLAEAPTIITFRQFALLSKTSFTQLPQERISSKSDGCISG